MARSKNTKNSFITVYPSHFLQSLLELVSVSNLFHFSPKKNSRNQRICSSKNLSFFYIIFLFTLIFFTLFEISRFGCIPTSPIECSSSLIPSFSPAAYSPLVLASLNEDDIPRLSNSVMVPLPAHGVSGNVTEEEKEFWKQPNGDGYKPCLDFSIGYRKSSVKITKQKRRFLVIVASGGLNQQRNQIIDAVIFARVLEAALVMPILQVNLIWGDESEFSDIFDAEHFKRTLQADVRIVSSLPSTHLFPRLSIEARIPVDVSPIWIRSRFFKLVIVLSNLCNMPMQVAFHALRFATPIRELGNKLTRRMWIEGPYIAIHLRLEKDVWVRTGCLTGLGPGFDDIIAREREARPEFLTGRLNMSSNHRRLAGLCPLNALEIAKLLKGLGAPSTARVYCAGGEPFGGIQALQALMSDFPNLVTKEMLAHDGELAPYMNRSSSLAALDYIVSLSSDIFMPSHGGNMGRAMQGHRAYVGHRKFVTPNKRAMLPYFEESSISDPEFGSIMKQLHRGLLGQPQSRDKKRSRDVIAYPVPECMCKC